MPRFLWENIITGKTCNKSNGTSIDILLTNRPRSFHKTSIFKTGISDLHKLILSFFRSYFTRIQPKTIEYRKYATFDKGKFLHDLDQELLKGAIYQNNEGMYSIFTRIFQNVLNKHAPLKQKKVRGNHAPFMTKDLSKAIINKSQTRNRYLKWPSRGNFLAVKSAKNLCKNLIKTKKKSHFQKLTQKGFANNKAFWNTNKPFLTNKGFLTSDSISLTQEHETITDKKTITHSFNSHYVIIVKKHQVKPLI